MWRILKFGIVLSILNRFFVCSSFFMLLVYDLGRGILNYLWLRLNFTKRNLIQDNTVSDNISREVFK